MANPRASAGWIAFLRRTAMKTFPPILNFCAETTRPVSTRAEPSAAFHITASDPSMKEGSFNPATENASPKRGAQTIALLHEWIRERRMDFNARRWPDRLASRIARVSGATVMDPMAIDVATVTVARGPNTEASNGNPTAAELGKARVKASTELS